VETFEWLSALDINICLGVDGVALSFILLTASIAPFCVLLSLSAEFSPKNFKKFSVLLILVEFFLILSFSALDLFLFYFAFESVVLPTFLIILLFGSRPRRVLAAYYLFFYTLTGSLLMLVGVLYIQQIGGTTSVLFLKLVSFSKYDQVVLFVLFFCAFASKIPMFPFYI
jgi:NADH-quinone oxidoreductase subunit M